MRRLILPLVVLIAALGVPAGAQAYSTGISDQQAATFGNPDYAPLKLRFARYITPYDVMDSPADKAKLIEATEAITTIPEGNEHPQGDKVFDGKKHQVFGHQNISIVEKGKLKVVHRTSIQDGRYENDTDYTKMAL